MMIILWCSSILAAVMLPILLGIFPMPAEAAAALKDALSTVAAPGLDEANVTVTGSHT